HKVAKLYHNKLDMRQWLGTTRFVTVCSAECKSAYSVREFGAAYGYPVIVKPTDGTASRGIAVIAGADDVDAEWERLTGLRNRSDLPMATFYPVDGFIAEEYIDGTEYSVESFSFAGRHIVVSITDKFHDGTVEMGHALPAILGDEVERTIVDHVTGFLTAMGLRDGIGHTELKLSSKGPRIIESHDRAPGDRLLDLMVVTHGVDLEQYASGWPLRVVPELTERPSAKFGSVTKWVNGSPGVVTSIEGVDEVRDLPGVFGVDVYIKAGEEITPMADNFGRHVQVLVTAESTAEAIDRIDGLIDRIRVHTEPTTD
ncbi:ATP-grasp domain-containing protein, partial [Nocardia sp. NPDC059228]|uniref:ATP-grasp domain-containing protein n=1 Tax=Nocardia sp. NPDC059228 TaxID=3346777 RepID=UPI0036B8654A